MSLQNSSNGTNWTELLDQIYKKHVPIELVREVRFIYDGQMELTLSLSDLDPHTLLAFGRALCEVENERVQIKLIVDLVRTEKTVSKIVDSMLKNLPRKV